MENKNFICKARVLSKSNEPRVYSSDLDRLYDKSEYVDISSCGIEIEFEKKNTDEISETFEVTVKNTSSNIFEGVIRIDYVLEKHNPKFYMPGYMYNRNTAHMPGSGRKAFPRIRENADRRPESVFFMTRSDRLAEPVSIIFDEGRVFGISAPAYMVRTDAENGQPKIKFCGFSCDIDYESKCAVGYTLGYENAPWLFVQTSDVRDREELSSDNCLQIGVGEKLSFELVAYSFEAEDERAVHKVIEDAYYRYYESPRTIEKMTVQKAAKLLSGAIRDYAWLEDENMYTGFVYDKPGGNTSNKIGSLSWTNGFAVVTPMLMSANRLGDEQIRKQCLAFIKEVMDKAVNEKSGLLYDAVDDGRWHVRGWWYDGMHSGGHSAYLNGQAVYYLLKAYISEKKKGHIHEDWVEFVKPIVEKVNSLFNSDYEYPFAVSEQTGAGIEYDSMGGAWLLAATALYTLITGDHKYLENMKKSEAHYYDSFVRRVECYGGPLDTDKAVDNEGILAMIRADRILHEITSDEIYLDHLRDSIYYEISYKLGYNTPIQIKPLSTIKWSSCGGSITSVANPHIHPMSSTVMDEMLYYVNQRNDKYISDRLDDTVKWSLQTFNSFDGEYGYGKTGWMSERFCFCEGLLSEKYPDGAPASTWFALMPWASGSILEGLAGDVWDECNWKQ